MANIFHPLSQGTEKVYVGGSSVSNLEKTKKIELKLFATELNFIVTIFQFTKFMDFSNFLISTVSLPSFNNVT